jgi:HTH-type transcriptional regulator, sugar sensing transcriptional regulator
MAEKKLKKILEDLGLSSTETRVYLSMLTLGPSSVLNISKKAGISRTSGYEILNELQKKGLASTFEKGKKTLFSAEDPERLEQFFSSRVDHISSQFRVLKKLMPELRLMQTGDRPRVRYYTGEEGLKALFRDSQTVKVETLFEFADIDKVYESLDEKMLLGLRNLAKHPNVPAKVLHRGKVRNRRPKTQYRQIKATFEHFQGVIWVYADRVAFITFVGNVEVIIVESEIFAHTMRAMFSVAWSAAK